MNWVSPQGRRQLGSLRDLPEGFLNCSGGQQVVPHLRRESRGDRGERGEGGQRIHALLREEAAAAVLLLPLVCVDAAVVAGLVRNIQLFAVIIDTLGDR